MATALVTGPTSGLGLQFAIQLAKSGHDLVLVSRDESKLSDLDLELTRRYHIQCEVIPTDLSNRVALRTVEQRLADPSKPIDWLVNNAGFGLAQPFLRTDVDDEQRLLDVLVTAPMRLTHAALPGMIDRDFGRVIVVSSFASWVTSGTYSAAKSWATVFVEGLDAEIAGTNVHATAVCPGFVRTEFHERADMDVDRIPSQLWLDAKDVVKKGIADCEKGRVVSVPGRQYQAMAQMVKVTPRQLVRRLSAMGTSGTTID